MESPTNGVFAMGKHSSLPPEEMRSRVIDQAIWEIWSMVRSSRNSLNSESICRKIRSVVDSAVGRNDEALREAERIAEYRLSKIRALNRQVSGLKKRLSSIEKVA